MEGDIRIGIAGAGFTGKQHTEALRRIPGLRVVALADEDPAALQANAAALGIEKAYTSVSEMIETASLDVLHNCTPNAYHAAINRQAMEKGLHVFCEKPLATTIADADALVALAKEKNLAAGVNFNYRSNAMVQEMAQRLQKGEAGRPLLVSGHYMQDWLMKDTDYSWRLDEAVGGPSRAVADIGSHWFDTAEAVLGHPIVRVFAKLFTAWPTRKKPTAALETFAKAGAGATEEVPTRTEDGGTILIEFEGGLPGSLLLSQISGGYKNDLSLCVSASNASLRWEQELPDRLFVGTQQSTETLHCAPGAVHPEVARYATLPAGHVTAWSDALRNNIREFYTALRAGTYAAPAQSYATFHSAAHIMRIVDACLESNKTQAWVDVDPR